MSATQNHSEFVAVAVAMPAVAALAPTADSPKIARDKLGRSFDSYSEVT